MKKIQVRVIVGSGSTQISIEAIYDDISGFTYSDSGFYTFYEKKHKDILTVFSCLRAVTGIS